MKSDRILIADPDPGDKMKPSKMATFSKEGFSLFRLWIWIRIKIGTWIRIRIRLVPSADPPLIESSRVPVEH